MTVQPNRSGTIRSSGPVSGFQRYDQCRFAISLDVAGSDQRLLFGTAHYQRDDLLGNILRISLETDSFGKPEIIIAEKEWNGLITSGRSYNCDYCLTVMTTEPASSDAIDDCPRTFQGTKERGGRKQDKKWWV